VKPSVTGQAILGAVRKSITIAGMLLSVIETSRFGYSKDSSRHHSRSFKPKAECWILHACACNALQTIQSCRQPWIPDYCWSSSTCRTSMSAQSCAALIPDTFPDALPATSPELLVRSLPLFPKQLPRLDVGRRLVIGAVEQADGAYQNRLG